MANRSLIQLSADVAALEAQLLQSGGELDEATELSLDLTTGGLRAKVDNYHHIIQAFEARAEYFAEIEAQAKAARKIFENQRERLRNNLRYAIEQNGGEPLEGDDWRFTLSTGKEKLVIKNDLPPALLKEKVTLEPDKETITNMIRMGMDVPGAELQVVTTLRSFVNTKPRPRDVKETK